MPFRSGRFLDGFYKGTFVALRLLENARKCFLDFSFTRLLEKFVHRAHNRARVHSARKTRPNWNVRSQMDPDNIDKQFSKLCGRFLECSFEHLGWFQLVP